jgi:uncharacterized protein YkwD
VEVRARSGGHFFASTDADSSACYFRSRDLVQFANDCTAENSPVARVYTDDYVGVDTGCTDDGLDLIDELNQYRAKYGLPAIPVSPSLCAVGQAHAIDLDRNSPHGGACNPHSWSNAGDWTPCCYTGNPTVSCMLNKPGELTDYPGAGYETAHHGSWTAQAAIDSLGDSAPHREVMLNQGQWAAHTWRAVGAGRSGIYWLLWFGDEVDPAG